MRRLLVLTLLLLPPAVSAAPLDLRGPTATGILHDRVLPLADIGELDGSAAAPAVSAARWRQAVFEIRRAADEPPAGRWSAGLRARPGGPVPLGLLHAAYDRLRERDPARARALVRSTGGALPAAALETRTVFTVAPLVERVYGLERSLVLDPARMFGNHPPPRSLELDADDGRGFRPLEPGRELAVAWPAPGEKTLRVRARTAGGEALHAAAVLSVAQAAPAPDDTLQLTATLPFDGAPASGSAYVYLAPGHVDVIDPVIVVEGFDLDNSLGWDELYELLNRENLLEDLRTLGYDAVVLDFTEATDPIQRNGFLLVDLIQEIESRTAPATTTALVGASMGGLVSRFALLWMEANGAPHRVRTFLGFDSPQAGANIPLGIQFWLDFFQEDSEEAAFLLSRLDTPAARQMLRLHHTAPLSPAPGSDPARAALDSTFAALGGYPAGPRTVAVANGSATATDQGFAPGEQVIDYEYDSFLVDIRGNVWAVPDSTPSTRILEGLNDIILFPAVQLDVFVSGTDPLDGAPGGSRGSMADMDAVAAPYGDIVALHPSHCFIPTVSALDLAVDDPFTDISALPDPAALSPFDAVYAPATNQEHVLVTAENKVWILDEITAAPTAAGPLPGAGLRLAPASPNPGRGPAELRFALGRGGPVRLDVVDVTGRRTATLVDAPLAAGTHEARWYGRDAAGRRAAAGIYFVRLVAPEGTRAVRLVRLP